MWSAETKKPKSDKARIVQFSEDPDKFERCEQDCLLQKGNEVLGFWLLMNQDLYGRLKQAYNTINSDQSKEILVHNLKDVGYCAPNEPIGDCFLRYEREYKIRNVQLMGAMGSGFNNLSRLKSDKALFLQEALTDKNGNPIAPQKFRNITELPKEITFKSNLSDAQKVEWYKPKESDFIVFEPSTDSNGDGKWDIKKDASGNPVINKEAYKLALSEWENKDNKKRYQKDAELAFEAIKAKLNKKKIPGKKDPAPTEIQSAYDVTKTKFIATVADRTGDKKAIELQKQLKDAQKIDPKDDTDPEEPEKTSLSQKKLKEPQSSKLVKIAKDRLYEKLIKLNDQSIAFDCAHGPDKKVCTEIAAKIDLVKEKIITRQKKQEQAMETYLEAVKKDNPNLEIIDYNQKQTLGSDNLSAIYTTFDMGSLAKQVYPKTEPTQ